MKFDNPLKALLPCWEAFGQKKGEWASESKSDTLVDKNPSLDFNLHSSSKVQRKHKVISFLLFGRFLDLYFWLLHCWRCDAGQGQPLLTQKKLSLLWQQQLWLVVDQADHTDTIMIGGILRGKIQNEIFKNFFYCT